jgi:hypothetical protein
MKLELIQPGNKKLGKHIYMWNMTTSILQCGRICKGCYAAREEARWPSVAKARQKRYEASLQPDFVSRVNSELASLKAKPKYFRIHASSEFYDQVYINKWVSIIKRNPDIIFYAYTKRLKDFDFSAFKDLPNTVLINSFHYGRLNYSTLDKVPKNAFICPHQKGTDIQCGKDCQWCMTKGQADKQGVWFISH